MPTLRILDHNSFFRI